jgi:hypothetical protein
MNIKILQGDMRFSAFPPELDCFNCTDIESIVSKIHRKWIIVITDALMLSEGQGLLPNSVIEFWVKKVKK